MAIIRYSLLVIYALGIPFLHQPPLTWEQVLKYQEEHYPQVQHISELASHATLIDVRSTEEFAISHIPGAKHLDEFRDSPLPTGPLVIYCTAWVIAAVNSSAAVQKKTAATILKVVFLGGSMREINRSKAMNR